MKMSGAKDSQSTANRKRQKSAAPVWRPVSTQSHSFDGDGEKSEVEIQVKELKYNIGSHASNTEPLHGEAEVMNEPVEQKVFPAALQDKEEGRAPEGGLMPSTEKHSVTVEAGSSLIRFIKGKGGSTQKKIEEELGVKIKFPSSRKDESIIIEGISADSVARASERIHHIIDEGVKSPNLDYSHFISLPLAIHPELVLKLDNFKNSLLGTKVPNEDDNLETDSNGDISNEEDGDLQLDKAPQVAVKLKTHEDSEHVKVDITNTPLVSYLPKASASSTLEAKTSTASDLGIDSSIFIKPKTFHLTVLMLKLWNKERVDAAAEILRSVSAKVRNALDGRPLFLRLKGLECMRGSLANARVLYAAVEEVGGEDRLLRACTIIIDSFVKGGLVLEKDAKQSLKLHATLMNARHRKRGKRTKRFDSFDARGIMRQYGSEEWGEYLIPEAHLSQRFVFDENGYYHCCASIPFPENMQQE